MFPSRIFMVSSLMFKSLIHFELIFVYSVRKWVQFQSSVSSFHLLYVAVQFSQHHLLKRMLFPTMYSWLCHSLLSICVGLFLGFLFHSVDLYVYFSANIILFMLL